MTNDSTGIRVLDGGVLIAIALGEQSASSISDEINELRHEYTCTEIALCELLYILCRSIGWKESQKKVQYLIESSAVKILPSKLIWNEAARIKCDVAIALPDCFTIAAARVISGQAIFVRKEKEIHKAIKQGKIDDTLLFLK
jgi:predicted nucleic acid-binding protein